MGEISENWQLMRRLFSDVLSYHPFKMILTLLLMLLRSITAGVGLLLIIPLLQVIGFSIASQQPNGLTKNIIALFQYLHLPLHLGSILTAYIFIVSLIAIQAYTEQIISNRLQQDYIHHLRAKLYNQLLQSDWAFFLQKKASSLLHGLTTQVQMISSANVQLLMLINHSILLSVYTVLALLLSWQMTLIAIICALILLSIMLPLHKLTSVAGRSHLQQNQSIVKNISEQLGALKMIKGSGFEHRFVEETLRISSSLEQENRHFIQVTAISKLLYSVGAVLIFSLLLYVALTLLTLSMPSLLLLLIIFSRLLPMVSTLQQNYQRLLHLLPSYQDIQELLQACIAHQEPSELKGLPLIFNDAIELKNISFSYPPYQNPPVIEHLSLHLKKNTTTAILGRSGAGKSTLADLIIGLLTPTEGTIFIDKTPLDSFQRVAWRRSIAYVTQDTFLFNDSIRNNLQLAGEEISETELWEALEASAASEFVAALEQGLDTLIGDRGVRLSGGERQRIALARALLTKPQLLVLDESTNSLDPQTIAKIQEALARLHGKITILIISHQKEMSSFADQCLHLSRDTQFSHEKERVT